MDVAKENIGRHEILAAVDLGSNSFHLQIARVVDDQIYLLDALREPVRLGAGLTRDRRLERATQLRALEALRRFGERLRGLPRSGVRAVGTNALRVARNSGAFLDEAEEVLGHPVEVIFGREEARLIYLGVAHALPRSLERRLVVDIGGGSTEFIVGAGLEPQLMESAPMGCVSYSLRYFPDGRLEKSYFRKAELAAANEIQRFLRAYRRAGWSQAVGSSGTARAIASILAECGWGDHGITAYGLEKLRAQLIKARAIDRIDLPGMREDRRPVLVGGVAILAAVFAELGIERMEACDASLRQGVLHDLLGRVRHEDPRKATVGHFQRRYHVDLAQAERVRALALAILAQLCSPLAEADAALLGWAAALHEIGISIAHAGYHKHSAYVLSQADMPGFSQREQARLARVVLAHRGKLSKTELEELLLDSADWPMIFALRMAALFYRSRSDIGLPCLACRRAGAEYQLGVPESWLADHPLTEAALDAESEEWRALGCRLSVRRTPEEALRAAG
ncbi:MAG: exopolyphosphatase [Burkholderiales bacterium]|nr:exopolyphosphatase [Burkholderiales bacterium]